MIVLWMMGCGCCIVCIVMREVCGVWCVVVVSLYVTLTCSASGDESIEGQYGGEELGNQ